MNQEYTAEDFNRITPEISRYLNQRLDEWAEWFLRHCDYGVGFPKQNTIYRMMTIGNIPLEYLGNHTLPTHAAAEEMETLIRIMAMQNTQTYKYANALREYYLFSRRHKRRTARALGISEALLRTHLENAHLWLSGWFMASYGSKFLKWAGRN